jgi:Cobalamin biosynthesis protein CobT VWA domain
MSEGILKENIDGEALLWAYARLKAEKTDRKHLFVFSDGADLELDSGHHPQPRPGDASKFVMSIWGAPFTFDNDGHVFHERLGPHMEDRERRD